MTNEPTIRDLATDPIISMLMRADGVAEKDLTELMTHVAQGQVEKLQIQIRQARANEFYTRLDGRFAAKRQGRDAF